MNHSSFQLHGWKYILTRHRLGAVNRTTIPLVDSDLVGEEPSDAKLGLQAIPPDCVIHKIKMTSH
jgi:hypothetical protein